MFESHSDQVLYRREITSTAIRRGIAPILTPAPRPWRPVNLSDWQLPAPTQQQRDLLGTLPYTPPPRDIPTEQLDDPARDTRRQLYQDDARFHDAPPVPGAPNQFANFAAYEVARFVATPDEAGIVKFCWTYAEIRIGGGQPVELHYGDPFNVQNYLVGVKYHLRLSQNTFAPLGPTWQGNSSEIPGMPFPELADWTDSRYMWGRTASDVFWLVPANFALRLFVEVTLSTANLHRVGGRLTGYTQPIFMTTTGRNVRHGW